MRPPAATSSMMQGIGPSKPPHPNQVMQATSIFFEHTFTPFGFFPYTSFLLSDLLYRHVFPFTINVALYSFCSRNDCWGLRHYIRTSISYVLSRYWIFSPYASEFSSNYEDASIHTRTNIDETPSILPLFQHTHSVRLPYLQTQSFLLPPSLTSLLSPYSYFLSITSINIIVPHHL